MLIPPRGPDKKIGPVREYERNVPLSTCPLGQGNWGLINVSNKYCSENCFFLESR